MEFLFLLFYVFAGFFDAYYKEGAKEKLRKLYPKDEHMQYSQLDNKYHHVNYWHLRIIAVWLIPFLLLSIICCPKFLIFIIPFYLEDLFYYIFSWLFFKQWIPNNLNWLYGDVKFYQWFLEEICQTNRFTKNMFYGIVGIQVIVFVILYVWLFLW